MPLGTLWNRYCRLGSREFSKDDPELMDLPDHDENELRKELESLGQINRSFGGRRAVENMFHLLAGDRAKLTLIDLASGYGDHARNLVKLAQIRQQKIAVVAVDQQFQTLQIARQATAPDQKIFFVQADARHLPFRDKGADLVFCTLALHHFSEQDAVSVMAEMSRIGRLSVACVDLVRSRLTSLAIWLMTAIVMRDPMTRHDARLSVRRAFTQDEMKLMAERAGWTHLKQNKFLLFQQGISAPVSVVEVPTLVPIKSRSMRPSLGQTVSQVGLFVSGFIARTISRLIAPFTEKA